MWLNEADSFIQLWEGLRGHAYIILLKSVHIWQSYCVVCARKLALEYAVITSFLQFLADLYSGKLHREFHYGPDKDDEEEETAEANDGGDDGDKAQEASSENNEDPSRNEVPLAHRDNVFAKDR